MRPRALIAALLLGVTCIRAASATEGTSARGQDLVVVEQPAAAAPVPARAALSTSTSTSTAPGETVVVDITAATPSTEMAPRREAVTEPPADPCQATGLPAGDGVVVVTSRGSSRSLLVHVPPDHVAHRPAPLLLDFHGIGGTAEIARRGHGFDALADREDVIVVYPQGEPRFDNLTGWDTVDGGAVPNDDVEFIDELLDTVEARWCVDPERIWATGHSSGGLMVDLLTCAREGRIRAAAVVSTFLPVGNGCPGGPPLPMLEIHGIADVVAPYAGQPFLRPVAAWMTDWASRNQCDPSPIWEAVRVWWTGCRAPVEHVVMPNQGHAYPDGAALIVWEFLVRTTK